MDNLNVITTCGKEAKLVEEVLNADNFTGDDFEGEELTATNKGVLSSYFKPFDSAKNSALVFGQTEEEIEKEFKNYKASKVFSKLNNLILDCSLAKSVLRKECETAGAYGFKSVTVTPNITKLCKEYVGGKTKVFTLISYPFGEDNFKVKLLAVKEAYKQGADGVTVALSVFDIKNASFKNITKFFKKIIQISRYRAVNVVIDTSKLSPTEVNSAVNSVTWAGKISSVIFSEFSLEKSVTTHLLKEGIKAVDGKAEVGVIRNVSTAEDTVNLLGLGVRDILSEKCNDIVLDALKRLSL